MYKIAGELTPFVLHVSARALATHALSIFGDHSDVMACRGNGFALLAANSVQEAQDFALVAQATTLAGHIPVLHFFDGFRTSHEVAKIREVDAAIVRAMIDPEWLAAHRARALSPEHPLIRGTSQNPDDFFQSRERANPWYDAFPAVVQAAMDRFAALTGRQYRLYECVGHTEAERVVVLMGSGAETAEETVEHLLAAGERVGLLKVRLFRPFDGAALIQALPATVRAVAVLDRCKEPGAAGEPLYKVPWPGRPPAGVSAAAGRQFPDRHRPLRETQPGPGDPGLGRGPAHPVRQVRVRLPAQRYPRPRLPRCAGGLRPARLQTRAVAQQGLPAGCAYQLPGGTGGLHRLRQLRRGLSHPRQGQRLLPGAEHGAAAAAAGVGA